MGNFKNMLTPLCTAPALGIMHVAPVKMIMGVDLSVQFIMKSFEKNVYSSFRSQYRAAVLNSFYDILKQKLYILSMYYKNLIEYLPFCLWADWTIREALKISATFHFGLTT